jgi:hypothetical protein
MNAQGESNPEAKAMDEKFSKIYKIALKRVMKTNMR